ncbi:CpsD/CapB family tyrosine-protein kinase [Planococcus shenhongbingii]|uniref:non-specific protein-tyrosine kinase n=1 Tax=Planococcus shenhongbingii TaxID=3058398 RepID=A0ABT8N9T0_9BACL|nr:MULTISPECIES: CpsD/CapB family tyrosine-protein kinase [unclassified Planococcus (in: firmicutes)]MDN7244508.1 CpsD/CapB family tyrosine-protein kinase [Planococcus sp. N017]WKA57669.1 CpsD/CapB family tyrosine-protein kinase [Planococcus sp. N016]
MWTQKKSKRSATRKLVGRTKPQSLVTEQYRTIRTNINFSLPSDDTQTILFTSASKEEGKSTTSCNMAIVYAESGKRVLLVDADMRRPTLHHSFQLSNKIGLSNLLLKKGRLQDTVKRSGVVGLDLLLCGQIPSNPAELLSSPALDTLLEEMKARYDLIIIDSPPLLAVTDSKILANKCDGTVLVVNTGKTEKDSVKKARDALVTSKAFILGVVMNNYQLTKDNYYYHNYSN